ncbi:MAG: SapB/AmfS family lanthipeptide [Pseudonocardiaceae bacterium]
MSLLDLQSMEPDGQIGAYRCPPSSLSLTFCSPCPYSQLSILICR